MNRTPATQPEIEIWLRDRLRNFPFYSRLRSITVWPTDATGSGWNGEVVGDFSIPEQVLANDILAELQRRFSLKRVAKASRVESLSWRRRSFGERT